MDLLWGHFVYRAVPTGTSPCWKIKRLTVKYVFQNETLHYNLLNNSTSAVLWAVNMLNDSGQYKNINEYKGVLKSKC